MKKIILIISFATILLIAASAKATVMPFYTPNSPQILSATNPLVLENAQVVPSTVYVGSSFIFSGTIDNNAPATLNNVTLTVDGGFPFSIVSPVTSFYVGNLDPGQTYDFSVPLHISDDATDIQYTLTMTTSYDFYEATPSGIGYVVGSQTISSTVKVSKGADLQIVNATLPQPLESGLNDEEVVVYIQNNGTASAQQIQLNLAAEYPFIPSGKSYFISSIAPGEIVPAIFHVDVDSSASSQTFPIDMLIKWKEGNNQYSDTNTFGLPVTGSTSPLQGNYTIVIIVVIILAAAGFVAWRRIKKKKRNAKA